MDTEVIVAGAGPVGLFTAGVLRAGGADVMLVDRLDGPTGESRASTLNARTVEILDHRGLLDRLDPLEGTPRGHFGGTPLDVGEIESGWPGLWTVPQSDTEAMLAGWCAEIGVHLRRSAELTGLVDEGTDVVVDLRGPSGRESVRAKWVIGCDGAASTVREAAGVEFRGHDPERELWRADLSGVRIPDRRFERHEHGLAVAARRPDGITRVMVHEFGSAPLGRAPSATELSEAWARVTGEDISAATPLWLDAFDDGARQAERYRVGRVLLAGDAAHSFMPAGGQALNLGVQDADNLAWKLLAVLRGDCDDSLLDSYHVERHPAGARVVTNVRAQGQLLLGDDEFAPIRTVLAELVEHTSAGTRLATMLNGLDVRYGMDHGPATPDDRDGDGSRTALLGRRLPHTALCIAGQVSSTTALLRSGRGVLLEFRAGAVADHTEALAAAWSGRVDVARAQATRATEGMGALLLRPDGFVAWAADPQDSACDGLEASLRAWFGAPAGEERGSARAVGPRGDAPRTVHPDEQVRPAERAGTGRDDDEASEFAMGTLAGKIALVTGSSRGIGRATAERLAREGALVAVHYVTDTDAAEHTVKTIAAAGGRAFTLQARLGVPGDADAVHDRLVSGLREQGADLRLDILVNNAGVMGGLAPEDITYEKFDHLMAVNARAPLFLVQRLLPLMPDGGRIVNITSGLTRFANPDELAYAMTKGALEQISLHMAKHLGARNITVNHVAPGVTNNGSPLFDDPQAREYIAGLSTFDRIGEPADVADIVAFVASADARWLTGSFIDASGGTLLGG